MMRKGPTLVGMLLSVMLPIILLVSAACGSSSSEGIVSEEPVTVKVIVTDVQVSIDGNIVELITVRTDEGKEISMRLSEDIDPTLWGPPHLLGHVQLGKLDIQIGVTYMRTPDGVVATELSE